MKASMNARKLRVVLLVLMFMIVIGATVGFFFAQRSLHEYAATISKLNANATTGDQSIQTLRGLEERLKAESTTRSEAQALVGDEATYTDIAIKDLSRIARESGVTITGFEFAAGATTPAAGQAAPAAPATAPAATPTPAATTPTAATGGVTKKTVSVSITSPLKYSSFMNFLKKLETNPLKMQVPSVAITKDANDMVSSQSFTIEMYVRS